MVENLPAMQETWVQTLGLEDPLEKGIATRSSILAWRIPQREEPGGLQSIGLQESDMTERLNTHTHTHTHFFSMQIQALVMEGIFPLLFGGRCRR